MTDLTSHSDLCPKPAAEENIAAIGLRERTADDFLDIPEPRLRREAAKEYQRTLDLFRQTGTIPEKTWDDYAHFINPPHLSAILFQAYCDAVDEVDRWKAEQAGAGARHEMDAADSGGGASGLEEKAAAPDEDGDPRLAAVRSRLQTQLTEREREIWENELAKLPTPEDQADLPNSFASVREREPPSAPRPVTAMAPPPPPALLRGVAFEAAVPSRTYAYKLRVPQLDIAAVPEALPAGKDTTEALLNNLIGECHFLMREVALPSLCQADVLEDRRLWANTAMELAKTGAKVAKSVAQLRHGSTLKETRHTTIIQNQIAAAGQVGGGGRGVS